MTRRLWIRIYFAFVAMLLGLIVLIGVSAHLLRGGVGPVPPPMVAGAELFLQGLPDGPSLQAALAERAAELDVDVGLWDAEGQRLASTDPKLPAPSAGGPSHGWFRYDGRGGMFLELSDGRWLAAVPRSDHFRKRFRGFLGVLLLIAVGIAAGSIPVARGITRRLEQLQSGVEQLGGGDLSARVEVCGRDEIAELAEAFNRSAEHIEELVDRQRRMLASASHELRSPLARVRMALELLADGDEAGERRSLVDGAVADIAELDGLVEDLLVGVRTDAGATMAEDLDLADLVAPEAERTGATPTLAPSPLRGDARMLRVLVRNLLENARRHASGAPVEVSVAPLTGGGARLEVADRGPGVADAERERIFEPFYRPEGHREGADGGVGLGLSLAREIARRHGGDVRHEPRDGGGSTFIADLRGL